MQPSEATTVLFRVQDITVDREARQRRSPESDELLRSSIETVGLINPIVIHADGRLVAGERRLEAHKALGLQTIRCTIFETLSPLQAFLIELQENIARKALSWQEEADSILRYHNWKLSMIPQWTQQGTATDIGLTRAHIAKVIAVAQELDDEEVRNCPTFTGAYNLLTGRADRALAAAQSRGLNLAGAAASLLANIIPANATKEERTAALIKQASVSTDADATLTALDRKLNLLDAGKLAAAALEAETSEQVPELSGSVLCADFLDWSASYDGPPFDVLHIDFPYGIGYSGARTRKQGRAHIAPRYADDPDIYFELLAGLFATQDQLAYPVAHCIFWFDMRYYDVTAAAFESAGWTLVTPHPLIWTKGYSGIASDVQRRPRHCYETALLFSRGDRRLVKLDKDHFECSLDEKLHINQKPAQMLRHFLSLVVDEHTAVLDPTCGSGSALAAARMLGASRVLGVELDKSNAEIARFVLQRGEANV